MAQASTDFDDLALFCSRVLGSDQAAPLKDLNGAQITAMLDAYLKLRRPPEDKAARLEAAQAFDDAVFDEPFAAYTIRNLVNGRAYVGSARDGFRARYTGCRWWLETHLERLREDVLLFGLTAFRVSVIVCDSEAEMARTEAELIRSHRMFTYNLRQEPHVR